MAHTIVGRRTELAAVRRLLDAVSLGTRALVLEGEAGIGKTVIWAEGVGLAQERGVRVLVAEPAENEMNLSFAALGDLLGTAAEEVGPLLPEPQRQALETALLLAEATGQPPERRAVGVACLSVLRELASAGPVLIAVDDMQWLDAPSRAALEYAVRRLRDERIVLLFAVRIDATDQPPPALARILPEDRRSEIVLEPLTLGALYHLVQERVGIVFQRPALRRLHETSGGNPFYALEIVRALAERGVGELDGPLPVPATIRDLVDERLAKVSPDVAEVLRVVALLADAAVHEVESALGDVDVAGRALEEAIRASLLEIDGERLRFSHPLFAAGVSAGLMPTTRRALHRSLAAVVGDAERRARHLALAADRPDAEIATALDDAAGQALRRGAPDAAADLCERAAVLTPAGDPRRISRLLAAVRHHYPAGNVARIRDLTDALVHELPAGPERAEALHWLAVSRGDDFRVAIDLCEQAREEARDRPDLLAQIEFFLSIAWLIRGDIERSAVHARSAIDAAERAGDDLLVAKTIAQRSLLETWLARVTPGLLERGVLLEEMFEFPLDFFSSPSAVLGRRLMYAGELDSARGRFEAARQRALEHGDEPSHIAAFLNLAELECRAGNWELAERLAEEGDELAAQVGSQQTRSSMLYGRALVAAHAGAVDAARAAAEESKELAEDVGSDLFVFQSEAVLGFVELSLGNVEAADRLLRTLPGRLQDAGFRDPGVCPVLPNAIEAALGVGDVDRAAALVERLEQDGLAAKSSWALAAARRSRGLWSLKRGDADGAVTELEHALSAHARLRMPFELARALLALGSARRFSGQKRAARETLEQAVALFAKLGAGLWVERTQSELGRIGGRSAPAAGALSATEARIAELVAAGRTNKEVAALLSLSARTVQWNLSKVYRKLGVRSRTELAASLASQQVTRAV